MALVGGDVEIPRLPVEFEEDTFGPWTVQVHQSHILQSKCSDAEKCSSIIGESGDGLCPLCIYNRRLDLPQVPEMIFPRNVLTLTHSNGCKLDFNALDALKGVSNGKHALKIACADAWKEARLDSGHLEEALRPFDWTFTTSYNGTLSGNFIITETTDRIDIEKLKEREKILFYHDITLFEDELHDHGVAVCTVKIRVMPNSFFILLRYFLRVDNVMIRINDTRIFHDFDYNYLLREYTSRESKVADLKVHPSLFIEPNEIAQFVPVIRSHYEKLTFQ